MSVVTIWGLNRCEAKSYRSWAMSVLVLCQGTSPAPNPLRSTGSCKTGTIHSKADTLPLTEPTLALDLSSVGSEGDAVDKGPGDIRVVKTLLSLKQRYWSRVAWTAKGLQHACTCICRGRRVHAPPMPFNSLKAFSQNPPSW